MDVLAPPCGGRLQLIAFIAEAGTSLASAAETRVFRPIRSGTISRLGRAFSVSRQLR